MKKLAIHFFLMLEIAIFSAFYFFGAHGFNALKELLAQNNQIKNKIALLNQEIKNLQLELDDFQKYPFYKEKIAREQLQMFRDNEEIYFYKI